MARPRRDLQEEKGGLAVSFKQYLAPLTEADVRRIVREEMARFKVKVVPRQLDFTDPFEGWTPTFGEVPDDEV